MEARPSSLRSCPHEFGHFWNRIFFNPDSCGRGLSLFDSLGEEWGGGGGGRGGLVLSCPDKLHLGLKIL